MLALKLARRAVEIEPDSPICLGRLAFILVLNAQWDEALETARAAVIANPCAVDTRQSYAQVLIFAGDPEGAVRELRLALSLDPFYPPALRSELGWALLLAGHPEEALPELRGCVARLPDYGPGHHALVVAAAETGRMEEACAAVREVLRLAPRSTIRGIDAR